MVYVKWLLGKFYSTDARLAKGLYAKRASIFYELHSHYVHTGSANQVIDLTALFGRT